jgi:crotonobetaine/carnitine-CoA ligase
VPDAIRGEEVKAYIVLKSPATEETVPAEEIWNFCKQHLAAFKVPRYLEYIAELPKTPSSKVQKNILRDQHDRSGATVYDRFARPSA